MEGDRARVVVIGGGDHRAAASPTTSRRPGWTDVVLLEKGELTSGSTCHAAGLVTQFNPSPTMMRFRRYSVELYEELGVFERLGSLRIASSKESLPGAPARRQPGPRDRARRRCRRPQAGARADAQAGAESLHGAVWVGERRLRRPAHGDLRPGRRRPRARRRHPHRARRVTGIRLGPPREVHRRRDRPPGRSRPRPS